MFHEIMAIVLGGAICAGWAVVQVWILRSDPGRGEIRLGCGNSGCEKPGQPENAGRAGPERFEV